MTELTDRDRRSLRTLALVESLEKGGSIAECTTDLIADFGHLCDVEGLDFVDIASTAISHWAVEREGSQNLGGHVTIIIE